MVCVTIDVAATGKRIRELIDGSGLKNEDILKNMNVTKASICGWKAGRRLPSIDNLVVLSELLGVGLDDIIMRKRIGGEQDGQDIHDGKGVD